MDVRWHGEARAEADADAVFYKDKQPGLAQRFLDSLEDTLRGLNAIHWLIGRWKATYASAGYRTSHMV